MPVKVYLAGPWAEKEDLKKLRDTLFPAWGLVCTAHWLDFDTTANAASIEGHDPNVLREEALQDLEDIHCSHALLLINSQKSEGKAVETGYALALHIPVFVVGPKSSVFHYLPNSMVTVTSNAFQACEEIALRFSELRHLRSR